MILKRNDREKDKTISKRIENFQFLKQIRAGYRL